MMQTETQKRLERVIDHIDAHLDTSLSVTQLSQIACFSMYHFHRAFAEHANVNIGNYVQLLKLKRASYQLAFRKELQITEIAFDAGYENSESFSRAFKKVFQQSPSLFRKTPDWCFWYEQLKPISEARSLIMSQSPSTTDLTFIDFPETKIAVLEHRGNPNTILSSVQTFIAWRKEVGLSPQISETYNIVYDDPFLTTPTDFRFDICASTTHDVAENSYGVVTKTIPANRCAVLRHIGRDETIGETCSNLFENLLIDADETPGDFPMFFHRVTLFPDVSEREMITDIYVPLK
ncbi:AraC family transcriptional regulator [Kordiimonas sp. SCSIO 12603]|uniref:AraC family transcriptional regulator n=1 Tax=Kordiimonas sp. SCSIO 12603 TaxID=2829596 RepID=UPI002102E1E9|nr:AraC family transcriptional regulator [Kordiimonas sp. SCSIO 12603]UTW58374.1 AraC family transcriptional regulator [Kordiimonas sp. SCSIO 12603]